MKSVLYNLNLCSDKAYNTFYDEYSELAFELHFFVKNCNTAGTIRLDTGNYQFCGCDSYCLCDYPINHIIARVEDTDKIDELIAKINKRYFPYPEWGRFEIDDDAINAENIKDLDDLSVRKMVIHFDASEGLVSFDGYDNIKVPGRKVPLSF